MFNQSFLYPPKIINCALACLIHHCSRNAFHSKQGLELKYVQVFILNTVLLIIVCTLQSIKVFLYENIQSAEAVYLWVNAWITQNSRNHSFHNPTNVIFYFVWFWIPWSTDHQSKLYHYYLSNIFWHPISLTVNLWSNALLSTKELYWTNSSHTVSYGRHLLRK